MKKYVGYTAGFITAHAFPISGVIVSAPGNPAAQKRSNTCKTRSLSLYGYPTACFGQPSAQYGVPACWYSRCSLQFLPSYGNQLQIKRTFGKPRLVNRDVGLRGVRIPLPKNLRDQLKRSFRLQHSVRNCASKTVKPFPLIFRPFDPRLNCVPAHDRMGGPCFHRGIRLSDPQKYDRIFLRFWTSVHDIFRNCVQNAHRYRKG